MSSNDKETVRNSVKEQNLAKALTSLKDGTYAYIHQVSKSTIIKISAFIEQCFHGE